jgi:hypothetical protein
MIDALRLHRGIAVQESEATSVMDAIRQDGLVVEGRLWSGLSVPDMKPSLEHLWRSQDLSLKVTRPEDPPALPRICASADRRGAMYYACSHNRKGDRTASILIEFEADLADVVVDGRDFLYTVMQMGNPASSREPLSCATPTAPGRCRPRIKRRGSLAAIWPRRIRR